MLCVLAVRLSKTGVMKTQEWILTLYLFILLDGVYNIRSRKNACMYCLVLFLFAVARAFCAHLLSKEFLLALSGVFALHCQCKHEFIHKLATFSFVFRH